MESNDADLKSNQAEKFGPQLVNISYQPAENEWLADGICDFSPRAAKGLEASDSEVLLEGIDSPRLSRALSNVTPVGDMDALMHAGGCDSSLEKDFLTEISSSSVPSTSSIPSTPSIPSIPSLSQSSPEFGLALPAIVLALKSMLVKKVVKIVIVVACIKGMVEISKLSIDRKQMAIANIATTIGCSLLTGGGFAVYVGKKKAALSAAFVTNELLKSMGGTVTAMGFGGLWSRFLSKRLSAVVLPI